METLVILETQETMETQEMLEIITDQDDPLPYSLEKPKLAKMKLKIFLLLMLI